VRRRHAHVLEPIYQMYSLEKRRGGVLGE